MDDWFPKAESQPIAFCNLRNPDPSDWLTPDELVSVEHHRIAQAQKGNSFRYQVIRNGRPAPTFSKTLIRRGSAALVLVNDQGRLRLPSESEQKTAASFPLPYAFAGNREASWARIGNSVPPLFMEAVARHIRLEILSRCNQLVAE